MKKIFRTVAALAVVAFAGCTNDLSNDVVAPVGEGTTVTVGLDTKTVLGELVDGTRKVYWSAGDQININGYTSAEAVVSEENKGIASFSFEQSLQYPYAILYPAEAYKDAQTITLAALQSAATGSFGVDAAPMAALAAEGDAISLHHLAAAIRLQIKGVAEGDAHQIYKVEFRGNGGEQVSGDFAIDYQTATLTATSTAVADQVVTARVNKSLSTEDAIDVFVVVPAQEYKGFTVRVIDENGHFMTKEAKGTVTLDKGQILAMPEFEFVPTGTDINVEISSAADLVAFAKDYNAGNYDDVRPLVIDVKNDIVFDDATNAEWVAIGGKFDGVDRYFDGVFNGNKHSIKNWNSVRPLFGYTSSSATIQELTIDASCTLTANYADESEYYGAFVGYHRGVLTDCHVNANLTATGNWTKYPHVGALVGRVVVGTVENCTVTGDVTIANTLVTTSQESYYGGAVGRISNPAGVVKGVTVSGNVSHSAGSTYSSSNVSDAYVYYGGIVGLLAGTCTDCHLSDATKKFFYGNFVYGTSGSQVENHYRTQSVGAIAGQVEEDATVSNCTNRAEVVFNQYNGSRNGTSDVSRYLYGGGIVGLCYGEVSNCTMYADLTNRSSCLQQAIGGVVGEVKDSATISNCANEGANIAAGTTRLGYYQARNNNIGGVIGRTYSTNLSTLTNKAEIVCSRMNSNASASLSMGGIIGKVEATSGEIDGNGTIVNYGTVYSNHTQYNNAYSAFGGVIGEAKCSVKNVVNEGKAYYIVNDDGASSVHKNIYVGGVVGYANGDITITSAENKGAAYINISKAVAVKHYNLCVGGILGTNNDAKAVALVSCENSGSVAVLGGGTKTDGRSLAVGGVVGALIKGTSSISGCTNTGALYVAASNNIHTAWFIRTAGGANYVGGIAGYVEGTGGTEGTEDTEGTAADLITVTNCTNNRNIGANDGVVQPNFAIQAVRGAIAGLVGGAKFAEIKSCNCTTKAYNTNSTSTAGLVSAISNSVLEQCTISNSILNPKGGVNLSGAVAYSVASTIKKNILNNVEITAGSSGVTNKAVLAGTSDSDSVFEDNVVSGTLQGVEITLDSTMIGKGTPTVTGTTLYTE